MAGCLDVTCKLLVVNPCSDRSDVLKQSRIVCRVPRGDFHINIYKIKTVVFDANKTSDSINAKNKKMNAKHSLGAIPLNNVCTIHHDYYNTNIPTRQDRCFNIIQSLISCNVDDLLVTPCIYCTQHFYNSSVYICKLGK